MSPQDLIQVSLYFCLLMISSMGYGSVIVGEALGGISKLGVSLLIGIGILGTTGVVLGTINKFEKVNLWIVIATGLVLAVTWLVKRRKQINFNSIKLALRKDRLATLLLIPILAITSSLYLAAMKPPMATDELHYHFPEAREIVESKSVNWLKGVPDFWMAIPKLMEVIFAEGLAISDYSLAHALNYAVMVGFLMTMFGVVHKHYGIRVAAISTLLILLFEDFTWNGTVGFVDTAATSFELAALLMVMEWKQRRKNALLVVAGILIGFALSSKYSPLPTALFVTILILSLDWKRIPYFAVPAVFVGGYWYLRNWISLGNPFYPMYFGHQGMSDSQYLDVMNAVWQWQPKTWSTFMSLINHYKTPGEMTTYVAIFAPLLSFFFIKKDKGMLRWLLLYYLLYVPYWFFFASHQIRFLATGLVIALLITGILLAKIPKRIFAIGLVVLLIYAWQARPYPERNLLQHYVWTKLHAVERQYALGNLTYGQVLTREFGCSYKVVSYLNNDKLEGNIIDNWSLWHSPSVSYYAKNNTYRSYIPSMSNEISVPNLIKNEGFAYYYVNEEVRKLWETESDDSRLNDLAIKMTKLDSYIKDNYPIQIKIDTCYLYKLN